MSKAILVIDIPEGINQEDYICDVIAHHNAYKPLPVCKMVFQWKDIYLKPMPDVKSETTMSGEPDLEAHGWNLCVEELEK